MTYVGAVRAALAGAGDPERAAQQQAYMKSELPYVGLGAPALKALLRPLLVEHRFVDRAQWEAAVLELWEDAEHREEWYAAIALLRHRAYRAWLDSDLLPLLEQLVRTGAWWDVVDEIASHLVGQVLLDHRAAATPVMDAWSVDPDSLWVRRTAMLAQLRHGEHTDTDLLERVLVANLDDTAYGREFFVRKALGWALRQHARTDPEWGG
ncbi:MAG TPA: DNA alkylation repair protein, partial [Nocardioides sp.]|nr:DNA alkylation repair protein [Nocardioides sp.]